MPLTADPDCEDDGDGGAEEDWTLFIPEIGPPGAEGLSDAEVSADLVEKWAAAWCMRGSWTCTGKVKFVDTEQFNWLSRFGRYEQNSYEAHNL
jgi:hypothetical protein